MQHHYYILETVVTFLSLNCNLVHIYIPVYHRYTGTISYPNLSSLYAQFNSLLGYLGISIRRPFHRIRNHSKTSSLCSPLIRSSTHIDTVISLSYQTISSYAIPLRLRSHLNGDFALHSHQYLDPSTISTGGWLRKIFFDFFQAVLAVYFCTLLLLIYCTHAFFISNHDRLLHSYLTNRPFLSSFHVIVISCLLQLLALQSSLSHSSQFYCKFFLLKVALLER